MAFTDQKQAVKEFIKDREWKWYEKWQSQPFWIDLLSKVLWVENPTQFIEFEDHVKIDKANWFIDWFIPSTKVLIEQKWINRNLREPIKQSDWSLLNPFQQAKRYSAELPYDKRPRWIITCNFQSFLVYDMNNPNSEPEEILLKNLAKEYYRLSFIVNEKAEHIKKEEEISFKAWELIGKIYDAFAKQYKDLDNENSHKSLNELCVRLVFCLYAEDAGIFGKKDMFHDYLVKYSTDLDAMRKSLIELFKILDTKDQDRDPYLSDELAQFPYVNWWLFSNENIEIPRFTEEIRDLILSDASNNFDWSDISPTIFWAVFESTLNPETRRSGGMHYTSIENIHKVIDPLFLDELREDLDWALAYKRDNDRKTALIDFQKKLASLKFFDPACGSGNFLTETYLSLRRLENEAIRAFGKDQISLDPSWLIKVNINQFYGIEINDFAVKVATTALWIAESQTVKETEEIVWTRINFLPLKSYTNIKEWNALRIDWNEVISNKDCNYIMGNPPFIWYGLQTPSQKEDMLTLFVDENGKPDKMAGKIDYVAWWYNKASSYMFNTHIKTAFVSTNSITQGDQVSPIWKNLYLKYNIDIFFAYKSFKRTSEASKSAAVFCTIIGFSCFKNEKKYLYDDIRKIEVKNISPYLRDEATILIESRTNPISKTTKKMSIGNRPADWGCLILTADDYEQFSLKEPNSLKYIKNFVGGDEYINGKKRYCLWLVWCTPGEIKSMPMVLNRVELCKADRLNGAPDRQKLADTPHLFRETNNPKTYLLFPRVSTSNRRYIPIGFLNDENIPSDSATIIENADLFDFWVLVSNVHMSWMRAVGWRLWNGYRYSKDIVYNNFPWPNPTDEQKKKIEKTAQDIIIARNLYPDSSLADLYDELTMPKELRKAHQENDKAVMEAYGFNLKMTESECVAKLMEMYQELTKN